MFIINLNIELRKYSKSYLSKNCTHPRSWLNIIVLDEQLKPVITNDGNNSYFDQVGNPGTPSVKQYNPQRPITKNGYVYIYVSNETPNIYTYWDNLQITHIHGHLLQEGGYYPFGLEMKAISSAAAMKPQTRYKFNAGTALEESFDVDYYETFFREYDAQIGRFTGVDAMSEKTISQSPYQFAINNPISFNDPTGLEKEAPKIDWSFYWYYLFTKSANESGMYGGSWTFNSSGQGDGSFIWLQTNVYSSEGGAVYDNLSNGMQYWNNEGENVEAMLNNLSRGHYINTSYGYNSKGDWGMLVSPQYYTQSHTEANGTQWTEGYYYTGFFVKMGNQLTNLEAGIGGEDIESLHHFIHWTEFGLSAGEVSRASKVFGEFGGTSYWVGKNMQVISKDAHPLFYGNQYAGSRKLITEAAEDFGKIAKPLGVISSVYSAGEAIDDFETGNTEEGLVHTADAIMGAIGTFGGPVGLAISGVYFISRLWWGD